MSAPTGLTELRRAWIDALRSGKYKQGTGALHPTADEFCCLGVLCDLVVEKGSYNAKWETFDRNVDTGIFFGYAEDGNGCSSDTILPAWVRDLVKVGSTLQDVLIDMNDNIVHPRTFAEIADHLEHQWGDTS